MTCQQKTFHLLCVLMSADIVLGKADLCYLHCCFTLQKVSKNSVKGPQQKSGQNHKLGKRKKSKRKKKLSRKKQSVNNGREPLSAG